jgi:tRNA dimethylallyltransferase
MILYLEEQISFERAVELIKQHTRNFAKRQLSWFRQESDIHWFNPSQIDRIEELLNKRMNS